MNDAMRRLTLPTYILALFFVVSPVIDIITNAWPLQPGNVQWRFGFAGITSNYLVSAIFGLVLAAFVAAAQGHRGILRITGLLSALGAAALLLLSLGLALDTLQLRNSVQPDMVQMFKIGAAKAFYKIVYVTAGLLLLAWGCFKGARATPDKAAERDADRGPIVLRP